MSEINPRFIAKNF